MARDKGGKDNNPVLSNEDKALWEAVIETVKPARPRRAVKETPPSPPKSKKTLTKEPSNIPRPPAIKDIAQGREIDRRTEQRLRRGKMTIDLHLDLHGMVQATAHRRLVETVSRAYQQNMRLVLVITGKGTRSREEGGILRQKLPEWCELTPLSEIILSISHARPQHGGEGAFYIYLRRKRSKPVN